MRRLMMAAAAVALGATPALGQVNVGGGLVEVRVQNVDILNNFLNNAQIQALNNLGVPISVQVPIGIAANVCGVNANVIAQQEERGDYFCEAQTANEAFANQVIRQKGLRQTR